MVAERPAREEGGTTVGRGARQGGVARLYGDSPDTSEYVLVVMDTYTKSPVM